MQQVSASSGLGRQAQGSVSSYSGKSAGDPPNSSVIKPARSKKRERIDTPWDTPGDAAAKLQRVDNGVFTSKAKDYPFKPQASSIVGKHGGISSLAHVDRFVSIMGCEWNDNAERQLDLVVSRTMLAKVVATTTDRNCLGQFLRAGGLAILDKWLQEVHRGKPFVNREISKDGERAVQELLLALLGALERLPSDLLSSFEACPIGKSVNLFHDHKHPEVRRRVQKLVEAWKKKVEFGIEQQEGRSLLSGRSSGFHQHDDAVTASASQTACLPYYSTSHCDFSPSPVKFASTTSMIQTSGGLLTTQAAAPALSIGNILQDFPARVAFPVYSTSDIDETEFLKLSQQFGAFSPNSENGRTTSSGNKTAVTDQPSLDRVSVSRVPNCTKNVNASGCQDTFTVAPFDLMEAPVSDLLDVSRDSRVHASKVYAASPQVGVTLPSRKSSAESRLVSAACSGLSRSSLQRWPCVTDCEVRSSVVNSMSAELIKEGIQLLGNGAASEGSVADTRGSDSLSKRSEGVHPVMRMPLDSSFLPLPSTKYSSIVPSRMLNNAHGGDHFDRFSSTVSSPSETSAHTDIRVNTTNPLDNCSETPNLAPNRELCASKTVLKRNPPGVDVVRGSLLPCPTETVGESQDYLKANAVEPEFLAALCAARFDNPNPHSLVGLSAMVAGREVANSHGDSIACSASICDDSTSCADVRLKNTSQKVYRGSEIAACSEPASERPIFDLNEVVKGEDGVLATPGPAAAMSLQADVIYSMSVPDFKPASPIAPIAVTAASKGIFALPSGIHFPKAEENGWKGSAPTSAFHRAQPRHNSAKPNATEAEQSSRAKVVVDFDLNVAVSDSGFLQHGLELSSSMAAASLVKQSLRTPNLGNAMPPQTGQMTRQPERGWDLNEVGGVGESKGRLDIDLNCGPVVQDDGDDLLANRGIGHPLVFETGDYMASSRGPSHPKSAASIRIPAFAVNNDAKLPYPVGAGGPWTNSGAPDGMFLYNILLQNTPGMACPLPSLPGSSYGGIRHGFSSSSMKTSSATYPNIMQDQRTGSPMVPSISIVDQSLLPSQMVPSLPSVMGIAADAIQMHSEAGFWNRSDFDLNAGPDGGAKIAKDDMHNIYYR